MLQLENFLPYRLNVLAETVSRSLSRLYDDRHGLTIPEWRVLATLGQYETMTAKQIGLHSHMHKTKVSRAVVALEARNFVIREVNEEDNREAFLRLTDAGKQTYRAVAPEAETFERDLLADLTPEELAMLDTLLTHLMKRSEDLTKRG